MNAIKKFLPFQILILLEMKIEDSDVFIEGDEKILGRIREKVGTLASVPSSSGQLPSSLRSFSVAILVRDLVQVDSRKNKIEYHLRQVATADDRVMLQWVCTQDLQVINQRNKDIELVKLSQSIQDVDIQADALKEEVRKIVESKEAEGSETDEGEETINTSNYEEPGVDISDK